ncbi:MAG: hypothetical protein WCD76_17705, partial [Pyrinomonadaceae bacterium]
SVPVADEAKIGAQVISFKGWSWKKTFGTAAAAALAAAAVVLLMTLLPAATRVRQTASSNESVASVQQTTDGANHLPTIAALPQPGRVDVASGGDDVGGVRNGDGNDGMTAQVSVGRRITNHARMSPAVYRDRPAINGAETLENMPDASNETAEIATDFISLPHASRFVDGDSGQVVRVELPRSALVRFGLPMNVEHAGERVKADVLMGDDGIARAIRFVQ